MPRETGAFPRRSTPNRGPVGHHRNGNRRRGNTSEFSPALVAGRRPSSSPTRATAVPARSSRRSSTPTRRPGLRRSASDPRPGRADDHAAVRLPRIRSRHHRRLHSAGASPTRWRTATMRCCWSISVATHLAFGPGTVPTPLFEDAGLGWTAAIARSRGSSSAASAIRREIWLESSGNVIAGNFIGTDPTGESSQTPFYQQSGCPKPAGSSDNTIGGTTPADRNVISGNTGDGVSLFSGNDLVQGNFIGTDATGRALGQRRGRGRCSSFRPA